MRVSRIIFLVVVLTGCTTDMGKLSIAATNFGQQQVTLVVSDVEGVRCIHALLLGLVPLGLTFPDIQGAVDEALRKAPGSEALINAEVYDRSFWGLLYNVFCVGVRGDAVKLGAKS